MPALIPMLDFMRELATQVKNQQPPTPGVAERANNQGQPSWVVSAVAQQAADRLLKAAPANQNNQVLVVNDPSLEDKTVAIDATAQGLVMKTSRVDQVVNALESMMGKIFSFSADGAQGQDDQHNKVSSLADMLSGKGLRPQLTSGAKNQEELEKQQLGMSGPG